MKTTSIAVALLLVAGLITGCSPSDEKQTQAQAQAFVDSHVKEVRPLVMGAHLANWKAANTGKSEDYDKFSELQLKLRQVYSRPDEFAAVKRFKESGQIEDPLIARQIDLLYYGYLENQLDPDLLKQIVELSTEIEKNFSTFRAKIAGEEVTDNKIKQILKTETDSAVRRNTWLASKQVGKEVAGDLLKLVELRNQAARKVGFENYHIMGLTTSELDVKELDRVFDELKALTDEPFAAIKAELDQRLAEMYGVEIAELMPWHYHDPFFQESPLVFGLDLDKYYQGKDVNRLATEFFDGIGLNVESIMARSDLYEREGKNPHAFCEDMDREGDIRILANVTNNEQWMGTMLHELGHAVYDKFHDREVPYLLRTPTHIFTTEAIAMFFGRLSRNADWMQQMLNLSDSQRGEIAKVSTKYSQLQQLVFARWVLVMYNFEKQLYANPDQDLNSLWWRMVEQYQFVKKPKGRFEPDWAAKIHFTIAPCYYHNYMLGELLASQLHNEIVTNVLKLDSDKGVSYVGQAKAGMFLRKKVFEPGAVYPWNEMIERATGETLTPKYFAEQFIN